MRCSKLCYFSHFFSLQLLLSGTHFALILEVVHTVLGTKRAAPLKTQHAVRAASTPLPLAAALSPTQFVALVQIFSAVPQEQHVNS